jgi:hypothetical protein
MVLSVKVRTVVVTYEYFKILYIVTLLNRISGLYYKTFRIVIYDRNPS